MLIGYVVDIHSNKDKLREIIRELKDYAVDYVFVGGDITDFDPPYIAVELLEMISDELERDIYFVPGNCDDDSLLNWEGERIRNLHARKYDIRDLEVIGLGGSNITPFHTNIEWSEEEIRGILMDFTLEKDFILVSHVPPHGTKIDKVMKIKHVGSKELRRFIIEKQPLLVLTGHIHESSGIDKLGKTIIVNPGPARAGKFALIKLENNSEPKVMIKKV